MKRLVTVRAHANIAMIKYWGKRNEQLFLPTKDSISVTLNNLETHTSVSFSSDSHDCITFNNDCSKTHAQKSIREFLDKIRKIFGLSRYFTIKTHNLFPTSSGLASSASGFAALAIGINKLCDLKLSKKDVSILARQGSGSAARSIHGGFVRWHKGVCLDGSDSYAEQLFNENYWPEFRVLVIVVSKKEKKVSSRDAMQATVRTSACYKQWLEESALRTQNFIAMLKQKDLYGLGELIEEEWLGMYNAIRSSYPAINYWSEVSGKIIQAVKDLRGQNISCFFTTDAGPHVKLFCLEKDVQKIKNYIMRINGIMQIITCSVAGDPCVLDNQKE